MVLQSQLDNLDFHTILFNGAVLLIISYFIKSFLFGYRNLPPGPYGLPLVGYLPFMEDNLHEQFKKLSKKYGKVFSFKVGSKYAVVIEDYKLLKEVFARPEFLPKPAPGPFGMIPSANTLGFGLENGKIWEEQRKHSLMMMRNAGMGKSYFEAEMQEEIRLIINRIEEKKGNACDITDDMYASQVNIMWMLLFGRRMKTDDPRRPTLYKMLSLMLEFLTNHMVVYFYPWMHHVFEMWKSKLYLRTNEHSKIFEEVIEEEINLKKKSFGDKEPTDFTDFFLVEMIAKAKDHNTTFTNEMMKGNVVLYFLAGIFSTRVSVTWLLLTMAKYPEAQERIYKEIEAVTGNTREVCWDDRKNTPFTMAVIHELQRWKTIVPVGDFRTCFTDVKFNGYDIPKGSMIFPRIWAAHYDEKLWKQPEKFMPERFLSEDGKSFNKPPGFLAFSQGRRNCPGEQVALMQIYLIFTWILQKFRVKPETGKKIDLDTEIFSFAIVPLSQKLCFDKRE